MKKVVKDLVIQGIILSLLLVFWSNMPFGTGLIILFSIFFSLIIVLNIFFIITREKPQFAAELIYTLQSFIIFSVLISLLLVDDFNVISGIRQLIFQGVIFVLLALWLKKEIGLKSVTKKTKHFIIFSTSLAIILLELISLN